MKTLGPRSFRFSLVASLAIAAACGSSNPNNPSGGGGGGAPGPSGATITILANGTLSPSTVTISRGQSVTIVNNDSRVHDMTSDPHPTHTDCQEINAVGLLQPSQSKLTNALNNARTCGLHDHGLPDDNGLKGRIIIQ